MSCYVDTTCRCVGQGMGNTTSVTDHIQSFVAALKIIVNLNFHIVEFDIFADTAAVLSALCRQKASTAILPCGWV